MGCGSARVSSEPLAELLAGPLAGVLEDAGVAPYTLLLPVADVLASPKSCNLSPTQHTPETPGPVLALAGGGVARGGVRLRDLALALGTGLGTATLGTAALAFAGRALALGTVGAMRYEYRNGPAIRCILRCHQYRVTGTLSIS